MKLILRLSNLCFLLYCTTHASGVTIWSEPAFDGEGIIGTELNSAVSLICQTSPGTLSEEELVWLRNNARVSLLEGNKNGRSGVCVTPVTHEDNSATFTCYMARNASVTASVTLNVTYPPMLSGTDKIAIAEGGSFVLRCDTWANPPVSSVTWLLNGTTVDLLGDFSITTDGRTTQLIAKRVKKSVHEGSYECVALSPKYGKFSKMFEVTVNEKRLPFPLFPMIAGLVVVLCTLLFAVVSRRKKIAKCCKGVCQK
ncbi:transmembrane and immunoglobulin domain-containing protein 1 [Thalassophryne amazonica]|uniref:transmembrane and immunoglobulin domain-containing protein 1 n=1 Tax=Thalassophryne amazonica TaxID=390379 RepID=UPI001471FEB9|nr:transmembrane and immunoglobulin domain-containing protein 1 [Thalassophryne amazonica]XP_034033335.1 transmembrane and immunoglobulin domain-containing protein 1 [Thalassophryne amazonica]